MAIRKGRREWGTWMDWCMSKAWYFKGLGSLMVNISEFENSRKHKKLSATGEDEWFLD